MFADSLGNKLKVNILITVTRLLYVVVVFGDIFYRGRDGGILFWGEALTALVLASIVSATAGLVIHISRREGHHRYVSRLSAFQLVGDIALITLIYLFIGSSGSGYYVLYFVPILYAIILFKYWWSFTIAVVAGLIVNELFLGGFNLLAPVITIAYLIVGIFGSIIAKFIEDQRTQTFVQGQQLEKVQEQFTYLQQHATAKEFKLAEAEKSLETIEQEKRDFVSLTTHQLRTPLAAINWTFDLLSEKTLSPEDKELLAKGKASVDRMNMLIDRIKLADTESSQDERYTFVRTDLRALTQNLVKEFEAFAGSKGVTLALSSFPKLPDVEIDQNKFSLALDNIIENAVTYSKQGGKVSIFADDSNINSTRGSVTIGVTDNGIGISDSDKKKIFTRFFRSPSAQKTETDGTGLGLFLAKEIIEAHGGEIWFESKEGSGTTFFIKVPLFQPRARIQ